MRNPSLFSRLWHEVRILAIIVGCIAAALLLVMQAFKGADLVYTPLPAEAFPFHLLVFLLIGLVSALVGLLRPGLLGLVYSLLAPGLVYLGWALAEQKFIGNWAWVGLAWGGSGLVWAGLLRLARTIALKENAIQRTISTHSARISSVRVALIILISTLVALLLGRGFVYSQLGYLPLPFNEPVHFHLLSVLFVGLVSALMGLLRRGLWGFAYSALAPFIVYLGWAVMQQNLIFNPDLWKLWERGWLAISLLHGLSGLAWAVVVRGGRVMIRPNTWKTNPLGGYA